MAIFNSDFDSKTERVFKDPNSNITLDIRREDLIHPEISGNKFRKLKYNIIETLKKKYTTILTYGGAFSNHIYATAVVAKEYNLNAIGVIRGEEIEEKFIKNPQHNPTLAYAYSCGMKLNFINREKYRLKEDQNEIDKLKNKYGDFYRIPEGGTNQNAVRGCEEILNKMDQKYDIIACCVGTGGTLAGLVNSSSSNQRILGFSALKGNSHQEIDTYASKNNYKIIQDTEFGGYAKSDERLVTFMNDFYLKYKIKLDPIYTGKMLYKLFKMIDEKDIEDHSKILAIHSGGLQGIKAFNKLQKSKNRKPLIFQ